MYVHQHYPRWKYHRIEAARIVHDPAAEDALGTDWADTPTAFSNADAEEAAEPATDAPKKKTRKG